MKTSLCIAIAVGLTVAVTGCLNLPRKAEKSSSVVAFLYPNQANYLPPTSIPVLHVPLHVGVAFVPSEALQGRGYYGTGGELSEMKKAELLERVAAQFRTRNFIADIQTVPSAYLRPGGGFENLDQVRGLLGVDVIVLVAYDQIQFTDQNYLSLSYWTIVGAYVFRGERNDTQTLMEAAVYDIPSRHLLFRAPGTSEVRGGSTPIDLSKMLRDNSADGFAKATDDLVGNLKTQLDQFKVRLKENPGEVQIQRAPGYTGAGEIGAPFAFGLALLAAGASLIRKRARS
jgi:rhombotail lipoprotein